MLAQRRTAVGGIAEAELLLDGGRELAVGKVAPGPGTTPRLELGGKEAGGDFHDIVKA